MASEDESLSAPATARDDARTAQPKWLYQVKTDLVNRVLQLPVKHLTVGNHYHTVKNLRILHVVQTGEPMREP